MGAGRHRNTVDADGMLKLMLDSLVEWVTKAGGREAIRDVLLAKAFDEMQTERGGAARRIEDLSRRLISLPAAVGPEEKVDALMLAIDELAAITTDETARQRIRPLVLRLGIWIGLDLERPSKGKRPLRRLRRGLVAFGQGNLPVRVHGARHVAVEEPLPAAPPPPRGRAQLRGGAVS